MQAIAEVKVGMYLFLFRCSYNHSSALVRLSIHVQTPDSEAGVERLGCPADLHNFHCLDCADLTLLRDRSYSFHPKPADPKKI